MRAIALAAALLVAGCMAEPETICTKTETDIILVPMWNGSFMQLMPIPSSRCIERAPNPKFKPRDGK